MVTKTLPVYFAKDRLWHISQTACIVSDATSHGGNVMLTPSVSCAMDCRDVLPHILPADAATAAESDADVISVCC